MDPEAATRLFQRLDRELWVVTASSGARRGGLIATFVSQASIVPELPRVLVGLARAHHTRELVEQSNTFGLHLLGEEHLDWVWRFGLRSGRDGDKLDGLSLVLGPSGAPLLAGARGWLDCRVEARLDTGDRTVYLAEVLDARAPDARPILTVGRMIDLAPADRREELREQLLRDGARDAAAIRAWRLSAAAPAPAPAPAP
ncbi:MAG TPA: flavin reductase family protein [Isosphaeraceae bacterium]|jgi:flavin reductase (DIM6/NTAB) family NADH-FMN oxidoreductase RutF